jgi:hypothetical protein
VQPDLGVDDDLLGGRQAVGDEVGVDRDVALDQGERDRTELVVAGAAADEADDLRSPAQVGAALGQPVVGAVEVQQRQPARRRPSVCTRATVSWPR